MSAGPVRSDADIALAQRRDGRIDVSGRPGADVAFEPGRELPFADRALASIALGDAVATLSLRDRLQLLIECRRVLAPGAPLLPIEPQAPQTFASLARWAALVGLVASGPPSAPVGWTKRTCLPDAAPLVSILIPASNPRYFLESLDSAIAQTHRPLEIVVCDDSEGDQIRALAGSRAHLAPLRYEKNAQRLKARGNYEKCLSLARGEFVKFLNDDDVLEPDCVQTLAGAFRQEPDLALATSHRSRIDAHSRVVDDIPATLPIVDRDVVVDGVSLANAAIMYGLNFIGEPSTALFRRRDFDPRPHMDDDRPFHFNGEEVRGAIDLAMWSRLLVQGNAAIFERRLSRFRSHDAQAQADAAVVSRSIEGIRGLQRQWIELGLFRRLPPHLLKLRSLARSSEAWAVEPLRSLRPTGVAPEDEVRSWRATPRHAFDFT
jgi:glycosyltransferase involved in cell wall biosynthesis